MIDDRLDLRFAEIPYELLILSEYIKLVERNLPTIVEAEKPRIWQGLDRDDPGERSIGSHLEFELEQGVTTRFLTASCLIAVWALYEAAVSQLAAYVRHHREASLTLSDLRGGFLERARKYFDDVLRFDLHPVDTDWRRLGTIAALRHALAHANGRLDDIKPPGRERIEEYVRDDQRLSIEEEYVIVSLEFVRDAHAFIDTLLHDLIERVKDEF
jgi:hypothetical protein